MALAMVDVRETSADAPPRACGDSLSRSAERARGPIVLDIRDESYREMAPTMRGRVANAGRTSAPRVAQRVRTASPAPFVNETRTARGVSATRVELAQPVLLAMPIAEFSALCLHLRPSRARASAVTDKCSTALQG